MVKRSDPSDDPFADPSDGPFADPSDGPLGELTDDPLGELTDDPLGDLTDDALFVPVDDPMNDPCPIEPIPGIGPPANVTGMSWRELQRVGEAADSLGIKMFICTNCEAKGEDDPAFFFKDGYGFVKFKERNYFQGACRKCAPEMHQDQIKEDFTKALLSCFSIVAVLAAVAGLIYWAI